MSKDSLGGTVWDNLTTEPRTVSNSFVTNNTHIQTNVKAICIALQERYFIAYYSFIKGITLLSSRPRTSVCATGHKTNPWISRPKI